MNIVILGIKPKWRSLDLTDLWSGERLQVRERLATRQLVRWDLLAVRLSAWPDGTRLLEGLPTVFPPDAKEPLLRDLRGECRRYLKRTPAGTEPLYLKRVAPMLLNLSRKNLSLPRMTYSIGARRSNEPEVVAQRA